MIAGARFALSQGSRCASADRLHLENDGRDDGSLLTLRSQSRQTALGKSVVGDYSEIECWTSLPRSERNRSTSP